MDMEWLDNGGREQVDSGCVLMIEAYGSSFVQKLSYLSIKGGVEKQYSFFMF